MEQTELNHDVTKVPWRQWELCRRSFIGYQAAIVITDVVIGFSLCHGGWAFILVFVGICMNANIILSLIDPCHILVGDSYVVSYCEDCARLTRQKSINKVMNDDRVKAENPRIATCPFCTFDMLMANAMGVFLLTGSVFYQPEGLIEIVAVTALCFQPFFSALYIAHTRKNCADCNPKTKEVAKIEASPEACENAVREHLNGRDVTYDVLMNGIYAGDISRATGYPYAMVRKALERISSELYVRLLNQSLIVRDLNV